MYIYLMTDVKFEMDENGIETPIIKINEERYFNWDVFESDEIDYTLSINRQGELHLIPTSSLFEVPEIPENEWIKISKEDFASKVKSNEFNFSPEKSAMGDEIRDIRLFQFATEYSEPNLTVDGFTKKYQS